MQDTIKLPRALSFEASTFELAKSSAEGKRPFKMKALSGQKADSAWGGLVIDLAGLNGGKARTPILHDHKTDRMAGYSTKKTNDLSTLEVEGELIETLPAGQSIIAAADGGFPWEASVGVMVDQASFVKEDESKEVNGRNVKGPFVHVEKSRLREISFVAIGADSGTRGVVLAGDDDGEIVIECNGEQTMSEPKTENASAPDVAKARTDGAQEARQQDAERLKALQAAFPDRSDFVLEQFAAGHDVDKAKAAFADVLQQETASLQSSFDELKKQNEELKAKVAGLEDGANGLDLESRSTETESKPTGSPKEIARQMWEKNTEGCRDRYTTFEGFVRFLSNELDIEGRREALANINTAGQ